MNVAYIIVVSGIVGELYNVSVLQNFTNTELTVLPSQTFFPARATELRLLWRQEYMTDSDWEIFFKHSSMVHFYASQTDPWMVKRDPHHEAYAYLAPRYCPTSYWSSEHF